MALRNITLAGIGRGLIYTTTIFVGTSLAIKAYSGLKYHDVKPSVAYRKDVDLDKKTDLVIKMSDNSEQRMLSRNGEYVNARDVMENELELVGERQKAKREKVVDHFNDLRAKLRADK